MTMLTLNEGGVTANTSSRSGDKLSRKYFVAQGRLRSAPQIVTRDVTVSPILKNSFLSFVEQPQQQPRHQNRQNSTPVPFTDGADFDQPVQRRPRSLSDSITTPPPFQRSSTEVTSNGTAISSTAATHVIEAEDQAPPPPPPTNTTTMETVTTLMIRNIPTRFVAGTFLAAMGAEWIPLIDFFYLPMDFRTGKNLGYAFVNFIHAYYAADFTTRYNGTCLNATTSRKVLLIYPSRLQGLQANIHIFKNSRLVTDSSPHVRPLISLNGSLCPLSKALCDAVIC